MRQPADLEWPRSLQRKLVPGERANDLGTYSLIQERAPRLRLLQPPLASCLPLPPDPKHDFYFTTEPAQASS